MVEVTEHVHGMPSWLDLGTPDPAGATEFYTRLFGWEATDEPAGEQGTYTMMRLRGKDVAALYEQDPGQRAEGIPPAWLVYITVDDVDDVAARVPDAGGKLFGEPFDVLQNGRMTLAQDPTGAVFALWQAKGSGGTQLKDEPGSLTWTELNTTDPETAARFYTELLGWRHEVADMGGSPYHIFYAGEESAAGMLRIGEDWGDVTPHWTVYFAVADCDAAVAHATEMGAQNPFPAMEMPDVGRFAMLTDPQGANFYVMQLPDAPA